MINYEFMLYGSRAKLTSEFVKVFSEKVFHGLSLDVASGSVKTSFKSTKTGAMFYAHGDLLHCTVSIQLKEDGQLFCYASLSDLDLKKDIMSTEFTQIGINSYSLLSPLKGIADTEGSIDASDYMHDVFWLNFFSPKLVDNVGRSLLKSAPIDSTGFIQELDDGGMLISSYNPFDSALSIPSKIREIKQGIKSHLALGGLT